MNIPRSPYSGYRFPPEIISYCVWLYFRFSVSYRDIEELMAERGVTVTYESIRAWCYKFGRDYATRIRARRGQLGDTWHLDEVYLKIDGRLQYFYGAPLTRMGASSISLCNPVETRRLPHGSLRSCCEARGMHRAWW
jgi:transposase-like protein